MTAKADQARSDWEGIFATETQDPRMRYVLQSIIESVVIDIITNKMTADDAFAEVIGRRITTMLDATHPARRPYA